MSPTPIRYFKTEEGAKAFAKELENKYEPEQILIFYEPEYSPEEPWSVNVD